MKNLLVTILLWGGILMPILNAQSHISYLGDTIHIINGEQVCAKIMHTDIHKLITDPQYKELISSFQTHLESIKEQIPDYLYYQITYVKDVNLIFEEITGTSKYKVENGGIAAVYNSNIAVLQSKNLRVELFFNQAKELFETDYNLLIEKALSKLKTRKKKFKLFRYRVLKDNYTYSFANDELIKKRRFKKQKLGVGLFPSFAIGLYKNTPTYDVTLGLGVLFNAQSLAYIFGRASSQHDKELNKPNADTLWGIGFLAPKVGGIHLAFPLNSKNGEIYDDLITQFGITVYPVRSISVTTNFNFLKGQDRFSPGLSIGYSF